MWCLENIGCYEDARFCPIPTYPKLCLRPCNKNLDHLDASLHLRFYLCPEVIMQEVLQ